MNYLDLILGGLILYGAVKGFFKGFIIEAASLLALLLGVVCALLFSASVGESTQHLFQRQSNSPSGCDFYRHFYCRYHWHKSTGPFHYKAIKNGCIGGCKPSFWCCFWRTKVCSSTQCSTLVNRSIFFSISIF